MKHQILDGPDFGFIDIVFEQPGETFVSESGAMVGRDTAIEMTTNMRGGLGSALKRKVLGGESLFQNTFKATAPGQRLQIAAPAEGDVMHLPMNGTEAVMIQSHGYLGSTEGIELDTKWGGAKGFLSGTGLFMIKATGQGDLFCSAYGAIHAVEIGKPGTAGEHGYAVDNDHILAFTEGVNYKIEKIKGLKSMFLSGEGYVAKFSGQGTVWLMSRNGSSLAAFIYPFRPVNSN